MAGASEQKVKDLMAAFDDEDIAKRQQAREALVELGSAAVPGLLAALGDPRQHVRWEAAKTLEGIADPVAADALVQALGDDDFDVRWVAAEALIALRRDALKPLMRGLTSSRDSEGMYKAAHHVIHHLASRGEQASLLEPLLEAFDEAEPELAVPVAADRALDRLA